MSLKSFLPISAVWFLAATTGSDVVARTTIVGESISSALHDHFYWAGVQFVGTLLLLAPFAAVAIVCAGIEKRARSRSAAPIFGTSMLALLYFYFQGYQASQHAALEHHWTAATLSIGLLPFFIGLPVVVAVIVVGLLAARFDRRMSATQR